MSERDTLYFNILGDVGACLHVLTKRLISQCQDGLITVEECMLQIDGVRLFNDALKLNINKYDESEKI